MLDARDESSARFAAWHATAVLRIAPGSDRAHIRAYATWQVAHQLAQTVQPRGEATRPSVKYARSLVSEAITLVLWLQDQELELADLRQDLVDEWIAGGGRQRRRVRLFLAWLRRANVTGALHVDWDDRPPGRPAIDDEQRFEILRRLLHDPELDPRDRFVGSVLLLYGKPTTRIVALRTTDIHPTGACIGNPQLWSAASGLMLRDGRRAKTHSDHAGVRGEPQNRASRRFCFKRPNRERSAH